MKKLLATLITGAVIVGCSSDKPATPKEEIIIVKHKHHHHDHNYTKASTTGKKKTQTRKSCTQKSSSNLSS